jgi:hypothetical protein
MLILMDNKPKPQGFFSALEELEKQRRSHPYGCVVGQALDKMEPKEREKLSEIFRIKEIPATKIAQVLQENGYGINTHSVRYHRAGLEGKGCSCWKKN